MKTFPSNFVLIIILMISWSQNSWSQETKSIIVKNRFLIQTEQITKSTEYESFYSIFHDTISSLKMNFVNPSIEFLTKKGNGHELVFKDFSIKENNVNITNYLDDLDTIITTRKYQEKVYSFDLLYNFNYRINKSYSKMEYFIGIGLNPFMNKSKLSPMSVGRPVPKFEISNQYGFNLMFFPKIVANLSEKISIEVFVPTTIFRYYRSSISNKNLQSLDNPGNLKTSTNVFFPKRFSFGVSFGLKI